MKNRVMGKVEILIILSACASVCTISSAQKHKKNTRKAVHISKNYKKNGLENTEKTSVALAIQGVKLNLAPEASQLHVATQFKKNYRAGLMCGAMAAFMGNYFAVAMIDPHNTEHLSKINRELF